MSNYAEFESPAGPVRLDQRPEDIGYEYESVARRSGAAIRARMTLTDTVEAALHSIADSFLGAVGGLRTKPDELSVEFGIRVSSEAGAIVSSDLDHSHFRVTMRWRQAAETEIDSNR